MSFAKPLKNKLMKYKFMIASPTLKTKSIDSISRYIRRISNSPTYFDPKRSWRAKNGSDILVKGINLYYWISNSRSF